MPTETMREKPIWYMRDNNTFRRLPLDEDEAMELIRVEFDDGYNYGTLCMGGKGGRECASEHAGASYAEFELPARAWLRKAVALRIGADT